MDLQVPEIMKKVGIEAGGEEVEARVAENLFQKFKGLSFCGSGKMLFNFSRDTRSRVDMMFLSKPLYLYFLDSEKNVIDVQKAEPWSRDPRTWRLYYPGEPYRYLLESFEKLELEEGEKLVFDL